MSALMEHLWADARGTTDASLATSAMAIDPQTRSRLALFALLVLDLVWLQSAEAWFDAYKAKPLLVAALVSTSAAALVGFVATLVVGGRWHRVFAVLFTLLIATVASLTALTQCVSGKLNAEFANWTAAELKIAIAEVSGHRVGEPRELLYEGNGFAIVGKKRSSWKRYRAVVPSRASATFWSRYPLQHLVPKDFAAFAEKHDADFSEGFGDRDGALVSAYLSWRFPEYIPIIIPSGAEGDGDVGIFEEDNRQGERGVYPNDGWIKQIVNHDLKRRLTSYSRLVRYTFRSPHYRTDLVDDPYFKTAAPTLIESATR